MITCEEARELIPWYVTGRIALEDAERIVDHLTTCADCQSDFAEAAWMRRLVANRTLSAPTPHGTAWSRVARKVGIVEVARIDVGSFLIGLNLGISAASRRYPVRGSLRVMGHNVRIVGRRREKGEKRHVQ